MATQKEVKGEKENGFGINYCIDNFACMPYANGVSLGKRQAVAKR